MKKLCFGSLVTVLVRCKAHSTTQKLLCGTMLLSLDSTYDIRTDDGATSALVKGTSNLSSAITDAAPLANKKDVAGYFKANITPLLDNNQKGNIVLALQDIIASDTSIAEDTVVEMVSNITKANILNKTSFVFEDLIAGIFLYCCIYPKNRGSQENIREITAEYIQTFDENAVDISFVSAQASFNSLVATEIALDAHSVALLTDTGGNCQRCARPLGIKKEGNDVNYATIVTLLNEDIVLCVDCAREIDKCSEDDKKALIAQKNELTVMSEVRDVVARQVLERQIEDLLREIDGVDATEDTQLKQTPIEVDKKIQEKRLRDRVRADVTQLYDAVNSSLDRLSGESKLNVDKFAKSIKRMYEDASEKSVSQSDIYNSLVDVLFERTGRRYREAAAVVISYFVQRCEVFDEITE